MKINKLSDIDHIVLKERSPKIEIKKIGIITHDYRHKEDNEYRDFSHTFEKIIKCLDSKNCDSILFSLFTIVQRESFKVQNYLNGLKNIKSVFIEEFSDKGAYNREVKKFIIYHKTAKCWQNYEIIQKFGTLEYTKRFENCVIKPFINEVKNYRIFNHCTVLLCGEINVVKYSPAEKKIVDKYSFMKVIPKSVKIILNPSHDRMTRFEMKLKRKYLSRNKRWVISVWNKGKEDINGNVHDGNNPAWAVFYNGDDFTDKVDKITYSFSSKSNVEIGILNMKSQ